MNQSVKGTLPETIKHLVMFSGGACSWASAKRVVERHGLEGVVLLFADTKMEDEDLYRFLEDARQNIGAPLVTISDGRNPWEVCEKERFIANSRIDPCSKHLKRLLLAKWESKHCTPEETTIHFGLDWTESHRLERLKERKKPWRVESYMNEAPFMDKNQMLEWLTKEGIEVPRLYKLGFAHNNCGGFCFKSGQAQFEKLLRTMPERYAFHEAWEEKMRGVVGEGHSILTIQRQGLSHNITLKEFRERLERQPEMFDPYEWGGCGCAVDDPEEITAK